MDRAYPSVVRVGGRDVDLGSAATLGWLAVAVATAAYVTALISQYGFGWAPCALCLWQRAPYVLGLAFAIPALAFRLSPRLLLAGAALCFAGGAGLAVYHSLVEFGVFQGLASCGAGGGGVGVASDLEEFLRETENEVIVDCGVRTPFLFGLTMGNWNALVSADIAALFALAAWRTPR